jgi:hypothetical protein
MLIMPAKFIRALGLKAGDSVSFDAEGNVATLKFYRVETSRTPALRDNESLPEAVVEGT